MTTSPARHCAGLAFNLRSGARTYRRPLATYREARVRIIWQS